MTFGQVVERCLAERGMSQSELARRIGTGRQTVNSIIKDGTRGPRLETAIAISKAFGMSLSEMVAMMEQVDKEQDEREGGRDGQVYGIDVGGVGRP